MLSSYKIVVINFILYIFHKNKTLLCLERKTVVPTWHLYLGLKYRIQHIYLKISHVQKTRTLCNEWICNLKGIKYTIEHLNNQDR